MGSACPSAAERWAGEAELRARAPAYDGPVVYVAPDAAVDGEGTRERPLPLDEAVNAAAPGSLLALALGTYDAAVAPDGSALVGACVSGTVIAPAAENPDLGAIEIDGSRTVLISNLSVTGNHQGVVLRSASAGVSPQHSLRDVTIRRVLNRGLFVTARARVVAQSIRLEEVRPSPVDGSRGRGGQVDYGAVLVLRDAYVVNNFQAGLMAFNPDSVLDAENVLVAQTARQGSAEGVGRGIEVQSGSASTLRYVVLLGNHDVGLLASDAGTTMVATGLLIQDTQPDASDQTWGRGISVLDGAVLSLTGATLRNNHDAGLFAQGIGTTVEARGLLVEGTQPQASDQTWGRGVIVQQGASLSLTGATLRNNCDVGLLASDAGTTVVATGLLVEETKPQASDQTSGWGIGAQDGASLTLSGAVLRSNRDVGLIAYGVGTSVDATGLLIEGTQPKAFDESAGRGVEVSDGASLTLADTILRSNRDVGLFAYGVGTSVDATGLLIEGTRPQVQDAKFGWGVGLQRGATLRLSEAVIRKSHDIGVSANGETTRLELSAFFIDQTRPRAFDATRGWGLSGSEGAEVVLSGGLIRESHDTAVRSSGTASRLRADRLMVTQTKPDVSDQASGIGLSVTYGALATLSDVVVTANREVGVFGMGPATEIAVARLSVSRTLPAIGTGFHGDGILLANQVILTGTDLTLWENARCGLQMAFDGVAVAVQGALIGRNAIGTNLQSSDFTRADLAVGLRSETYWENGLDLGAESLPLPDPVEALESLDPNAP
jgi:hypothetical protein